MVAFANEGLRPCLFCATGKVRDDACRSCTADAECSARGHTWAWVRTWGDCGFRQCRRCGSTSRYGPLPARAEDSAAVEAGATEEQLVLRARNVQIVAQRQTGERLQVIAARWHLSDAAVSKICKAAGLDRRGQPREQSA